MPKHSRRFDVQPWEIVHQELNQTTFLAAPAAAGGNNAAAKDEPGASGVGNSTAASTPSGALLIDGLLTDRHWSSPSITYSDPDSAADYQAGYFLDVDGDTVSAQNDGFAQISASQLLAVQFAIDKNGGSASRVGFAVEGFTGLGVNYAGTGSGTANLRIANTSDNTTGYGNFPANTNLGGDAWLGTAIQTPTQGNYEWNNTLHELGHVLGLKHGHQVGGPGNTALPAQYDSLEYTVMTYRSYVGAATDFYKNGTWDYPQTYMMADIAALQYLYGADYTTNDGNTVYSWNPTDGTTTVKGEVAIQPGGIKIFATIWDGGGRDTYDLSLYTTSVEIDLRPGQASTFSTAQLADLGFSQGAGVHMAAGNIFNALLHDKDQRSLIENATGGTGGDTIVGNMGQNGLKGGLGDDTLTGGGAQDMFYFRTGWGTDTVTDFTTKGKQHDIVNLADLDGVKNFNDLIKHHISMNAGDAWIENGAGDLLILVDTKIKDLVKGDFEF